MNIGHNGWLSINLEKYSGNNITDQFAVEFNATAKVMPFNDAADYTAQLIASKYDNLHLSLSGGLDSEFVANVLTRNNIKFTPVILEADFCVPETWYAYRACEELHLSPMVLDYNGPDKHIELVKEIIKSARRLNVACDQGLLTNVIASLVPTASIITGYGEVFSNPVRYSTPLGTNFVITEHDYYLEIEHQNVHPGAFLSYSPELFCSMVANIDCSKHTQMAKAKLYNLIPRSKIHENIFNFYPSASLSAIMDRVLKTYNKLDSSKSFYINRDTLLNQLTGL